jgi:hypothetical protein
MKTKSLNPTKSLGEGNFNMKNIRLNCESEITLHSTIDSAHLEPKKPSIANFQSKEPSPEKIN